jgi:hypothetical protein
MTWKYIGTDRLTGAEEKEEEEGKVSEFRTIRRRKSWPGSRAFSAANTHHLKGVGGERTKRI